MHKETPPRHRNEPVNIDPRTLVPRVIREDNRYEEGLAVEADSEEESTDS